MTPLPVDPPELFCTPIMFARFVCALLSFRARKFSAKYETREHGKIIVECASYVKGGLPLVLIPQARSNASSLFNEALQIICGWVDGRFPSKDVTDYSPCIHLLGGCLPAGDWGNFLPCHGDTRVCEGGLCSSSKDRVPNPNHNYCLGTIGW